MCCCNGRKGNCQRPENLEGKPEECSPQRVRNCHGDAGEHACAPGQTKRPHDAGTTRARINSGADRT